MSREPNAHHRSIHLRRVDIAALIVEVTVAYEESFERREINLELDVPQNLWVNVDNVLMREVFRKLIDNAIEAMPSGGELSITSLIGRHGLEIEFADSGCGVSDELRARIFEAFATTKHGHAGLGLSMVKEIIESHQGEIAVDDCPQGGTAFTLCIPLRESFRQAA